MTRLDFEASIALWLFHYWARPEGCSEEFFDHSG